MWFGQRNASPWLHHGFKKASLGELKRLTVPAFASLAFPLGNALNIQGMRLIVGLTLGPSAVAVFTPLRTLSNIVIQPVAVIYRMVEPELAIAFGAKDFSLFRRLFGKSSQLSLWACIGACLIAGIGAQWIFPAWTSGKVAMHWPTYFILLFGVMFRCIWGSAIVAPYATNRHIRIAIFYIPVYGALAVCLGYFATKALGISGAALALLLAEVVMAFLVVRVSLKIARMSGVRWVSGVLYPPLDILLQAASALRKRISLIAF